MISLANPRQALDRELLNAPGGFAWWYMDVVDENANGCVLIWSYGLPFLPGREGAARRGAPVLPGAQPSLNIAVYRQGKLAVYLLQRHDSDDCSWAAGSERMEVARSWFESTLHEGKRSGVAHLDIDLPGGERLTGTVRVSGPVCDVPSSGGGDPRHQWTPLCTATSGEIDLRVDGQQLLKTVGRGYHDRNGSTEPLAALGIRDWLWGRTPCGDGERIWYLLWPESGDPVAWGLEVGADGSVCMRERLDVERSGKRLGVFGMPWYRNLRLSLNGALWMEVEHADLVDNGFFYLRWLTKTSGPNGERGRGVAEAIRPNRVDRGWNRWLVRMAVHHMGERNSPFLQLFAGVRGAVLS